jgi:hypothetical protein
MKKNIDNVQFFDLKVPGIESNHYDILKEWKIDFSVLHN